MVGNGGKQKKERKIWKWGKFSATRKNSITWFSSTKVNVKTSMIFQQNINY